MPIIQEFVFIPPEGQSLTTLHQWVSSLSSDEQTQFQLAESRQLQLRQKIVEVNKLTVIKNAKSAEEAGIIPDSYVWDETHVENKTADQYKEHDDEWLIFWQRYLKETGTRFEIVEKKI